MTAWEQTLIWRLKTRNLYYLRCNKNPQCSIASFVFFVLVDTPKGWTIKNVTGDIAVSLGLRRNRQQEIRFSIDAGAEEIADQLMHKYGISNIDVVNMARL